MNSAPLRLDTQVPDLLMGGLWCLIVLAGGLAVWRLAEGRGGARLPWGLCFALGCAAAMWAGTVGLAIGMGGRALPLFSFAAVVLAIAAMRARPGMKWLPPMPTYWTVDRKVGAGLGAVAVLGLALMTAMLARPHLSYDILSYHLPIAHAFRAGAWGYMEGNVYSRMPGGAFVLYGPALSDRATTLDDPGVRVLLWAAITAGALLCAEIAGQLGGRWSARGFAAALFVWHPMAWGGLANAHNDLLVAVFALGAVSCVLRGTGSRFSAGWIVLGGLLGGSAVAVKFSALGIVAVPLAVGVALMARGDWRARGKAVLWLSLGGFIAFGPWMVRAWWFGGHPLHPFMGIAEGWSGEQSRFITGHHQPTTPLDGRYWVDVFRRMYLFGFTSAAIVSPGALGMVCALMLWRKRRRVVILALMAWLGYAALLTVRLSPDRFAFASVALGCIALAMVSTIAWRRPIRRWGIAAAAGALVLVSGPWVLPLLFVSPNAFDRGGTMPEEILLTAHDEVGEGRALLLFEARGRWFPGDEAAGPMMNTTWDVPPWTAGLRESEDGVGFARWLAGQGITVVVVNEFELGRLVDFYGESTGQRAMGFVGVEGRRDRLEDALASYRPHRFARLSHDDREVLRQFMEWSRVRAKVVVPAGEVARIWVTALEAVPPAPMGDDNGAP